MLFSLKQIDLSLRSDWKFALIFNIGNRMNKLIVLSVVLVGYMFASNHGEALQTKNQSNVEQYSWVVGSSDDDFKVEGRRRGKGNRGRRRGGGGLR